MTELGRGGRILPHPSDQARVERRAVGPEEEAMRDLGSSAGRVAGGVRLLPDPRPWAGPLAHRTARSLHHAALLQCQRTHGNAFVQRMLRPDRDTPRAASLSDVAAGARSAAADPGVDVALAGVTQHKDPPDGMAFIAAQGTTVMLAASPAGYTGIKHAAAFTVPSLVTRNTVEMEGFARRHFAEVEPTTAADATHDSFYLGAGDHDNGTSTGGGTTTYRYFTRVSPQISDLIRRGEQEHLDDAQRAFDLSYGLAAREINALVGRRFGPASTPSAAEALARTELASRLPAALGTDPAAWVRALDAMLAMSSQRDRRGLHDIEPGPSIRRGNTFYKPLRVTGQTAIGQIPSDQIVNYPATGQGGGSAPQGGGAAPSTPPNAGSSPPEGG